VYNACKIMALQLGLDQRILVGTQQEVEHDIEAFYKVTENASALTCRIAHLRAENEL